jgi:outer membrane protein
MRLISLIIFVLLFLSGSSAYSQELTLQSIVDAALKNNPDIQLAQKDISIAQAQAGQTRADIFMPSLTANASAGMINQTVDSYSKSSSSATTETKTTEQYSIGATLSKDLFSGFRYKNNHSIKRSALDLAERKYDAKKRDVILQVKQSFYHLLLSEHILLSKTIDASYKKDLLAFVQMKRTRGLATDAELLDAVITHKNAAAEAEKARHTIEKERRDFFKITGIALRPETKLNTKFTDIFSTSDQIITSEDTISRAQSLDSTLLAAEQSLEEARLSRSTESTTRLPVITGSGSYKYDYRITETNPNPKWRPTMQFGLSATANLDDLFPASRKNNTLDELDETIQRRTIARDQEIIRIKNDIEDTITAINDSRIIMNIRKDQSDLAAAKLDSARQLEKTGKGGPLDITAAQSALSQATSDYYQSAYDYYTAVLKFKRLTGEDY